MRHYHNPAARCPYYTMEDSARGVTVHCKGEDDIAALRLLFRDGGKAARWKRRYCQEDWQNCPYAKMHGDK